MPDSARPANILTEGWARLRSSLFVMDSLDSVEVLIVIEEAFGVEVSDAEAEAMTTPRHVVDWLLPRVCQKVPNDVALRYLQKRFTGVWQREQIAAVVRAIIVEQTGTQAFDEDSSFGDNIFS